MLIDDDLGKMIEKISDIDALIILDCCHAGTATKGLEDMSQPRCVELDIKGDAPLTLKSVEDNKVVNIDALSKNHVVMSGCAAHETAMDTLFPTETGHTFYAGVFSYHLANYLRRASGNINYGELIQAVSQQIKSRGWAQTPQLEGNADKILFTSTGIPEADIPAKPFVTISDVSKKRVKINAGSMEGVTKRSIYAVFKPGEMKFTGVCVGKVKITDVFPSFAWASIVEGKITTGCRATEIAHAYPTDTLFLRLEMFGSKRNKDKIKRLLAEFGYVSIAGANQYADKLLRITVSASAIQGELVTIDGLKSFQFKTPNEKELIENLSPHLKNAYIVKRLIALKNPNPSFRVKVWVDKMEDVLYHIGDTITFKFKSDRDCYLTLLNVGTTGTVTVLYPNKYSAEK